MKDQDKNELFEQLLSKSPRQRHVLAEELDLSEQDRSELESLAKTADDIWISAHGAPPLEEDRTAALLGLVPNKIAALDGKKLSAARKRSRLKISELATRLQSRGWKASTNEVFDWERGNTFSVSPALIDAIGQIVGASVDQLISSPAQDSSNRTLFERLRSHPDFKEIIQQWAKIKNLSLPSAEIMLGSYVVNAAHRGNKPDLEQEIALLKEMIDLLNNEDDV